MSKEIVLVDLTLQLHRDSLPIQEQLLSPVEQLLRLKDLSRQVLKAKNADFRALSEPALATDDWYRKTNMILEGVLGIPTKWTNEWEWQRLYAEKRYL